MSFPLPPLPKRSEKDYEIGELLGRGNFTSVYQAEDKVDDRQVALKIVDRYRCQRLKKTNDLYMEKHCLLRLNHPNVVKMLAHFTDTLCVWVVMEECAGGELWDLVKTSGCPDNVAKHYIAQLVNAMQYLRDARVVHRDLKCENIMLTDKSVVKLIDFGTAKDLDNPQIKASNNQARQKVFEDYVGTPQFMPPEVIENKFTDQRSDTWSLGCTFYQMLVGVPPFHGASEYLIFLKIMDLDIRMPPGLDPLAKDLISRMVVKDADERIGAHDLEDIRRHAYLKNITFEDIHERPAPIVSLANLCLRKIGKQMKELQESLTATEAKLKKTLQPQIFDALERMKFAHKIQEDATPPEADV